jgi:hypothetical protein
MIGRLGGAVAGLVLALGLVGPAAAQDWWPAYGNYGYGTGFENSRNPYGYPRPTYAEGPSIPQDDTALYGGYMPVAYYTGAGYARDNATVFPSGRAYCQAAGSYLYCADIQSGSGQLMALRNANAERDVPDWSLVGSRYSSSYAGILNSRTVGGRAELVGTLQSPDGAPITIECTGAGTRTTTALTCR